MATWDPGLYARFGGERERPARDLLAAVAADAPGRIVDLGCGTGALARACAARWPAATVTGVDSSAEMLARAAATPSPVSWSLADVARWVPDGPVDLIVSNAALHWLGDHPTLFQHLVAHLSPGGTLAVQMPRNHDAPSHRIVREAAADGPWAAALGSAAPPAPVSFRSSSRSAPGAMAPSTSATPTSAAPPAPSRATTTTTASLSPPVTTSPSRSPVVPVR
jgi:trans-aconitate 2-methyltransferase